MRVQRFAAPLFAALLQLTVGTGHAVAFTSEIVSPTERTAASIRPGGSALPNFATKLQSEILAEIRRNVLPFQVTKLTTVRVRFMIDRRGQLTRFEVAKSSGSKVVDGYAEVMVRQASPRFPTLPTDPPYDFYVFNLPINFHP